ARISLARSRINEQSAWRQLAAELGLPHLPRPDTRPAFFEPALPAWDADVVQQRVLAANAELRQAAVEATRARPELERARAEARPNVRVGAGYSRNFAEREAGAVVSLETPLPLWDRKQGLIQEARAKAARAEAAEGTVAARLVRETVEAWARYQGARQQAER